MKTARMHFLIFYTSHPSKEIIPFFLRKEKIDVTVSVSYSDFLHYLKNSFYDAFILIGTATDILTHKYISKARRFPEYRHTPILIYSHESNPELIIQLFEEGADDIIYDNPDRKIILEKLKSLIRRIKTKKAHNTRSIQSDVPGILNTILLISDAKKETTLPHHLIYLKIKKCDDPSDFFSRMRDLQAAAIILSSDCSWGLKHIRKIKSLCQTKEVPLILLVNKNQAQQQQDSILEYTDSIIITGISDSLTAFQVNSHLSLEYALRRKYINALTDAANKSPMHSAEEYDENNNNIRLSILHKPFERTPGGDFYEVFEPNEQYRIVIYGDVMGKKWGAWLFVQAFTGYVHSTIRALTSWFLPQFLEHPSEALRIINHFIYKDFQWSEVFTTMSIMVIDLINSSIKLTSAGNLYPIFSNNQTNQCDFLTIGGPLLGVVENPSYTEAAIPLHHGDKLLCYTDGYSEAVNNKTEELIGDTPIKKLLSLCRKKDCLSPLSFEKRLIQENHITNFSDDRTLIIISKSHLHFLPPHRPQRKHFASRKSKSITNDGLQFL